MNVLSDDLPVGHFPCTVSHTKIGEMFYEALRARQDMTCCWIREGKSKRSFSAEDGSQFADPQIDLTGLET